MIKPTSLWNFIHECEAGDAEYIGRICLALAGKDVSFSRAERIQYLTIAKDNADMDERISEKMEKDRERKRRWKNAEERGGTRRNAEGAESASPSIRSVPFRSSVHPSVQKSNNRSVSVPLADGQNGTEPNANGTGSETLIPAGRSESHKLAAEFAKEVSRSGVDGGSVFFDGRFDAVTICLAITGDFKSARRWRQIVNTKGEAAVREEAFAFWRELQSGEDADNRGAALNARLGRLADIAD